MILITLLNIAIFQGIILGIIILKSPIFKSNANKYLAYAIFSLSISLLDFVLDDTGIYNSIPLLLFVEIIDSSVFFPVFIFLYVVHQIDHPIKNSKKKTWLFALCIYMLIYNAIGLDIITDSFQIPYAYQIAIFIIELIGTFIIFFFIPGILIFTYTFIKFSNNNQEKRWLTHLWLMVFVLLSSWILAIFSGIFFNYDFTFIIKILTVIVAFLIQWISYFGIFKFRLAKDQEGIRALIAKRKNNSTKQVDIDNKLPQINDAKKIESFTKENFYFMKLENLCIDDHIYRDSALDRDKVAVMLGISTGYVSQLVNTVTGNNFATYINHYRVVAVKNIILNSEFDNYSLLAIGLECGFSSKSTFYNAFKKITDTTPNEFRKKYK